MSRQNESDSHRSGTPIIIGLMMILILLVGVRIGMNLQVEPVVINPTLSPTEEPRPSAPPEDISEEDPLEKRTVYLSTNVYHAGYCPKLYVDTWNKLRESQYATIEWTTMSDAVYMRKRPCPVCDPGTCDAHWEDEREPVIESTYSPLDKLDQVSYYDWEEYCQDMTWIDIARMRQEMVDVIAEGIRDHEINVYETHVHVSKAMGEDYGTPPPFFSMTPWPMPTPWPTPSAD